tara:strand:- start:316 stop:1173 length:858 start_codon:yes stop_codon:yes gene_type:complete
MKDIFEFVLAYIFLKTSKLLGLRFSSLLGGILLYIFGFFSSRNRIGMRNLSIVFPKKTFWEKKKILSKMWFHFGRVIGEYPHLNKIKIKNNPNIQIINIENLLGPLKNQKNCIFFSAHLGNWELSSHPLTQNGHTINFIYRSANNKLVDNLLNRIRSGYGVKLISKGKEGAKDCIKALKTNENLGMLIDQKMNDGLPVKFFNRDAMTATAIAKFALKFNCPIIPAVCIRVGGIKFCIEYFKPIYTKEIKKMGSEKKIMLYLNSYVEDWIIKNPEQWIWVHNRWKD